MWNRAQVASRAEWARRWERAVVRAYTRAPDGPRRAVLRAVTPGFRVGALVVLTRPDGRVLLVDQPYLTGWSLPGGTLDRGDDPRTGAVRELREELGVELDLPMPVLAALRTHDRWVTFVLQHDVDDALADRLRAASPELSRIAWFAPDALPALHGDAVDPLRLVGLG